MSATTNAPADAGMTEELLRYLQQGRDALLRSLDGLDDNDVRRPLTPGGTTLLGLVEHVAGVEDGSIRDSAGPWATVEVSQHTDDEEAQP